MLKKLKQENRISKIIQLATGGLQEELCQDVVQLLGAASGDGSRGASSQMCTPNVDVSLS